MPFYDYACKSCGFKDEYLVGGSTTQNAIAPTLCPKCTEGIMEKVFSVNGFNFDIIGWSPDNQFGKKNWKRRLSPDDQAAVLSPDQNGKFRDPW